MSKKENSSITRVSMVSRREGKRLPRSMILPGVATMRSTGRVSRRKAGSKREREGVGGGRRKGRDRENSSITRVSMVSRREGRDCRGRNSSRGNDEVIWGMVRKRKNLEEGREEGEGGGRGRREREGERGELAITSLDDFEGGEAIAEVNDSLRVATMRSTGEG
jgi:hypothetical protein